MVLKQRWCWFLTVDDEAVLDDADVDEEMRDFVRATWESEFCPVASDLLARIESHQSQLEPLKRRPWALVTVTKAIWSQKLIWDLLFKLHAMKQLPHEPDSVTRIYNGMENCHVPTWKRSNHRRQCSLLLIWFPILVQTVVILVRLAM